MYLYNYQTIDRLYSPWKRVSVIESLKNFLSKKIYQHLGLWRNGSACDSRSQGYPFESGWAHTLFFAILFFVLIRFLISVKTEHRIRSIYFLLLRLYLRGDLYS